ncbi:hypothetical protein RB200_40490 [Streptomyces sp. PmtG]
MTLLVLPAYVPWQVAVSGFHWWLTPFAVLAAVSLVMWAAEAAQLVSRVRQQ